MTDHPPYGTGRIATFDPKNLEYKMRAVMREEPRPRLPHRYYSLGPRLDQGTTSQCVAFSWDGSLSAGPKRIKNPFTREQLYNEAKLVDPWPGEDYDGTSVGAGAKVLEKAGVIKEYRWAYSCEDVIDWILTNRGPVVLGTTWYESMFTPDKHGGVRIEGPTQGGHAYLAYGANQKTGRVACVNSWGYSWGRNGLFYLTFEQLDRLIKEDGEACTPTET
jgi:hypothetical protein